MCDRFPFSFNLSDGSLPILIGSILTPNHLLVVETRSLLNDDLWIACDDLAHRKAALLAALVNEAPSLFALFTPNPLHL